MTRLDIFINRMTAQRDLLNLLRDQNLLPEGPIMEVGLGNGRTYSHMIETFPGRRFIVFDRHVAAHKTSIPPEEDLVIGEIRETARNYIGSEAALVHADIGTGYPEKDAVVMSWLPELAAGMLRSGGYAVSGLALDHPRLEMLPIPDHLEPGRYYLYRKI
ncbi:hypothetical protein ACO34A_27765 (plasmid) [Rhizobium sp. ACO-34A]|nr:class I SAM-dependent methyltransferase [Rhizobium sp. ACO-34A]ATN37572.1 hypothetical protein ACO34A_27765 [Rhizobium sp. ACO-34A]